MLDQVVGVVEVDQMEDIAGTDRQVRPRLTVRIRRDSHPAAAAAVAALSDQLHRERRRRPLDPRQHNIVVAGRLGRAPHVADEDVIPLVNRDVGERGVLALADGGHVVDDHGTVARQPRGAGVLGVIEVDVVRQGVELDRLTVGIRVEGVGHAWIAAAVHLKIHGREGRADGQNVESHGSRNADRAREGLATVGAAGVLDHVDRCRDRQHHLLTYPGGVDHTGVRYSDVGAAAIDVGGLELLAAFEVVEVADNRVGRRSRLVQIHPDRNRLSLDEVLLCDAVGYGETYRRLVLEDRSCTEGRADQAQLHEQTCSGSLAPPWETRSAGTAPGGAGFPPGLVTA